jgi:hypothetical protein
MKLLIMQFSSIISGPNSVLLRKRSHSKPSFSGHDATLDVHAAIHLAQYFTVSLNGDMAGFLFDPSTKENSVTYSPVSLRVNLLFNSLFP